MEEGVLLDAPTCLIFSMFWVHYKTSLEITLSLKRTHGQALARPGQVVMASVVGRRVVLMVNNTECPDTQLLISSDLVKVLL